MDESILQGDQLIGSSGKISCKYAESSRTNKTYKSLVGPGAFQVLWQRYEVGSITDDVYKIK